MVKIIEREKLQILINLINSTSLNLNGLLI